MKPGLTWVMMRWSAGMPGEMSSKPGMVSSALFLLELDLLSDILGRNMGKWDKLEIVESAPWCKACDYIFRMSGVLQSVYKKVLDHNVDHTTSGYSEFRNPRPVGNFLDR